MSPATSSTILEARRGLTVGAGGWFGQPVCTDAVKVKVMVFVLIYLLQHLSKLYEHRPELTSITLVKVDLFLYEDLT
jgi:hypothetical protein